MAIKRFVDAHVHLWKLNNIRYPWLTPPFSPDGPNGSVAAIAHDYGLAQYFVDAQGFNVEKIVHIDAGAYPEDALKETHWLQNMAYAQGFPHAIVAFAALNDPDVEAKLAAQTQNRNVRGIRHILNWHPDPARTYTPQNLFDDEALAHGYGLLGTYNLSFDLQIYPNQMIDAYRLASRFPGVPVIINHMGMPILAEGAEGLARWKSGMQLLASLPHVSVKISGMGFYDRNWTTDTIRPLVLETIDQFGPERCAFASDFPTDKLFNSYPQALEAYDEITASFSEDERDAMFAANASRIYRI
ncbi:amidohydrolase family protein [Asticcacaulis sp. EMRT-3]|uniref:amidohydrolase family protein n=1 Tax=Asticcacaulis sp. EMRT-3 TaxID=3040349 RepID=UPI0024AFE1FF|nr:amidohydrolase family protein [Asticcacaulis sp. EMRT-3]MDI7776436.1 amidohydrolase family protein [Asticcacaulis sp. EMRT-3]